MSSIPQPQLGNAEAARAPARDDRASFDALFDTWLPRVYAFARARVTTDGEAEWVTEQVGIRIARRARHPLPSDGALASCLLAELLAVLGERPSPAVGARAAGAGPR